MDPKEYYYYRFRGQFEEWARKSNAHAHPGEGTYIPIQDLRPELLTHIPKDDLMFFYCALACTVLIDQIMYTHFKKDYFHFQKLTLYPKIEWVISNLNVSPWAITRKGTDLSTLELFLKFFISDLEDFFSKRQFIDASWNNVMASILNDTDCIGDAEGKLLKKTLEGKTNTTN